MARSQRGSVLFLVLVVVLVLGIAGYFVRKNYQLKKNERVIFSKHYPPSFQETETIEKIEILSTDDWKEVANNGIHFKIPPEASCDDEDYCGKVSYSQKYLSHEVIHTIYVKVQNYTGSSRKKQFMASHAEITDCKPIYKEAMFGSINALQIAIDGGWCQGGSGGIVTVVGKKLVTLDGGLTYNTDTKTINRWRIRDTLISTLKTTG